MTHQHHQSQRRGGGVRRALRGVAAAVVLAALIVGLPWLLVVVTGSPIPDHLPDWDEVVSAVSRRDDGSLLLAAVKYLTWICWAVWVLLVIIEAIARMSGRAAPRIPGFEGPQRMAALLVGSLGAAVLGTSMSLSRAADSAGE